MDREPDITYLGTFIHRRTSTHISIAGARMKEVTMKYYRCVHGPRFGEEECVIQIRDYHSRILETVFTISY